MPIRKRPKPADYFSDWKQREALAESMIPIVGRLSRERRDGAGVRVNGKRWTRFNTDKEVIELAGLTGTATVTAAMDALFRFKVDFVRKRALPLLKGHAHLALERVERVAEHAAYMFRGRRIEHGQAVQQVTGVEGDGHRLAGRRPVSAGPISTGLTRARFSAQAGNTNSATAPRRAWSATTFRAWCIFTASRCAMAACTRSGICGCSATAMGAARCAVTTSISMSTARPRSCAPSRPSRGDDDMPRVSAGLPTGMEGLTYPIPFSDPENVIKIAQAADLSSGLDSLYRSVHSIIGTVMPAKNFCACLLRRLAT